MNQSFFPSQKSPLDSPDPDWRPYLHLFGSREAVHPEIGPCFICEGRYLVEEALKAAHSGDLRVLSVLTTPRFAPQFHGSLPDGTRFLVAEEASVNGLLGFQFHRGVLCCVQRPPEPSEECILSAKRLLVLPRLDNVDNLGQLLRTAAALGVEAVLTGKGPGPFDRRTVRVSMGAAWRIPVLQTDELFSWIQRWRAFEPSEVVGAALTNSAKGIQQWTPAPRTALVLGPEDKGLDGDWLALCDRLVVIPMARHMDSLNVAAAGAILMHWMMGPGATTQPE
jgi:tRNA G18 (ribose-2'-O)-methylase SpoU